MMVDSRKWTDPGSSRIPYWIYSDAENYQQEMEKIFYGPHWSYIGLEAEVPKVGDFRTSWIGERPLILTRSAEHEITVMENRCAHRGVRFCRQKTGNAKEFVCPYHQWMYDLQGNLIGVPFRRGVRKQGGMPKDFDPVQNGLRKLRVEVVNGLVWATYSEDMPDFRTYMGPRMMQHYQRVYSGRPLRVLGYNRQRIPANWKLMMENIKDPYHAGLLHVFFVTFGLFRADQKGAVEMDDEGRHSILISRKGEQAENDVTSTMRNFDGGLTLDDMRILDYHHEWQGEDTVGMITVFPSVILQQQVNSLSTRQIVPRGTGEMDFIWTHFGYADDDEAMLQRRLDQANLFGPAGLVSADDGEVVEFSQDGLGTFHDEETLVEMGGRDIGSTDHIVTESAIRGMYDYYRRVMGL